MNTGNLLKNKWIWIIGGIVVFFILISLGDDKKEEVRPIEVSQKQQVEVLFPVKQFINKTPSEIEAAIGKKLEIYGKKPSGKLMEAALKINDIDVWTVYTLVKHEKVKYNGTILFQISFDDSLPEDKAWQIVDFTPPIKNKAIVNSNRRVAWENIPEIAPFNKVDAWYVNNNIESLKFYLLSEAEEWPLYRTPDLPFEYPF